MAFVCLVQRTRQNWNNRSFQKGQISTNQINFVWEIYPPNSIKFIISEATEEYVCDFCGKKYSGMWLYYKCLECVKIDICQFCYRARKHTKHRVNSFGEKLYKGLSLLFHVESTFYVFMIFTALCGSNLILGHVWRTLKIKFFSHLLFNISRIKKGSSGYLQP